MSTELISRCTLMADNRDHIRKGFVWEDDLMSVVAAMIFTGEGRMADVDRLKECNHILKERKGIFSDFRSYAKMAVISKMALAPDPEHYLEEVSSVYDLLRQGKLFTSNYMVLAAMVLCDCHQADRAGDVVEKTKELLARMKKEHPFLTGSEDMAFAALMALSDKSVDRLVEEMEDCYQTLKKRFPMHSDAVQSLSQILAVSGSPVDQKCERVQQIYDALKARGAGYGKNYELPSLGALADLEIPVDQLADEIVEALEYLKTRKGFGWTMGRKTRLMFAAMMAADIYMPGSKTMSQSVISGSMAIVIAEMMAMMVCIMAASSSTSHSTAT